MNIHEQIGTMAPMVAAYAQLEDGAAREAVGLAIVRALRNTDWAMLSEDEADSFGRRVSGCYTPAQAS